MVEYAVKHNIQMSFSYRDEEEKRVVDPIVVCFGENDMNDLLCWDPLKDSVCRYKLEDLSYIQLCDTIQTRGLPERKKEAYRNGTIQYEG